MSTDRRPVDDDARRIIRTAHDATLFVDAGAGTGKTTALVDRVVALVASGRVDLRNLGAITFTDAAAAELRDRIRYALELAAAGDDERVTDPEERDRCRAALGELEDAALSTLHGFAQRILGEHPLEAGLPARFEVIDDVEASVAFEQRWGEFVDALFDDPSAPVLLLTAFVLGLSLDGLRAVARSFHEHLDRLPDEIAGPGEAPRLDAGSVLRPLDEAIGHLDACRDADDRLARHLTELVSYRDSLTEPPDELELLDLLASGVPLSCRYGNKGKWAVPVQEVRDLCTAAEQARDDLLSQARLHALTALAVRVHRFVRSYADERRREGRLEFHDLLVLARDVLRAQPAVRTALLDRFHALLIDEFQDTDPLQIEIAVLLATGDPDAPRMAWHDVAVEPGRLFVVGDPKQSIYRFRRADLALYHRVEHELGAELVSLDENFRSVPGVIDWVNHVFAQLLAESPGAQARHVPLHAYREPLPGASVTVGVIGGPHGDERIGSVREREAAEIAALVRRIKAEGWPVLDKAGDTVRSARFADIALLLPTRTTLPEIEHALEQADVPVRIESQSLVFSTAEVRDLLNILTALDDPTDEVALVASLRSPAFACRDDELVEFRLGGGRWDYRCRHPAELPEDHPVVRAMRELGALHERRVWQTVAETVETVVRERRLLELAVGHRRPRDHWRRVRFFLDQARAWDDAGGAGLRGFVDWVQQQAGEQARAVEVVVPEPDDDAVRVLTVHGAKGLEFPVVVLAGLNTSPYRRRPPVLWSPTRPEIGVGSDSSGTRVETPGYAEQRERAERLDAEERIRLLYVAATRARDHLVVSLHHKATDRDSHAAMLRGCLEGAPSVELTVETPAPAPDGAGPPGAGGDVQPRVAWLDERAALLRRAGHGQTVAATALAQAQSPGVAPDPGLEKEAEPEEGRPPWQRGRAGTALGRAVHATLQSVDLATGEGLEATARAQAWAEEIPSREGEVRALVESVLASPVVRDAIAGGRYWREVPVAANVDGITVEGFVDLLVDGPSGLVVVDYKTDRAPGEADLDASMAKYRVQGAAYALALERVLGRPVARCVFVFARRGEPAVERDVADLPAAVAEVGARVRAGA
ncbi:MAG: UvrD-helicase domain-containing protein [Acidimicrobiia bacterium]